MKRFFLIFSLLFLFNSCELDENNYYVDILPVHSVEMPSEFTLGLSYQITMRYYRPTNCHSPNGIYYEKDLNIRTCAIKNLVEERSNCAEVDDVLVEETFNFKVTNTGNYVFKFWTGKDDEGNDTFMIYDIPVN